jgi:hypothetical protein
MAAMIVGYASALAISELTFYQVHSMGTDHSLS